MTNATLDKPATTRKERRAARTRATSTQADEQAPVTPESTPEQPEQPAPEPEEEPEAVSTPTGKVEKATEWVMGKFTPNGIVVALRGDHNSIEKASAKLNKEAKMRVAFVVDIRAVPVALLANTKFAAAEEAAMYGMGEGEDEEGEEGDE